MALVPHLLRRQLGGQPIKTLLAALGIALGIATVVLIFTLDTNTIQARVEARAFHYARVDFQVLVPADVQDAEESLRAVPGVAKVARVCFARAMVLPEGNAKQPVSAELIGLSDGASETFQAYDLAVGTPWQEPYSVASSASKRRPVLVGRHFAETLGFKPGTAFTLHRPVARAQVQKRCDGGIEHQVVLPAAPEDPPVRVQAAVSGVVDQARLGLRHGGKVLLVPFDVATEILETDSVQSVYWVHRQDDIGIPALMQRVRAAIPRAVVDPRSSAVVGEDPDERAFRNGVRVCGVLALMLGLFVIFHTLSMSLVERMRQIGLLSSLGMTRFQMTRLFLYEAAFYAAIGALAGAALGLLLAHLLLTQGITTLGVQSIGVYRFVVPWQEVLAIAAIGFLVALCGTIYPLWRSRQWTPSKLLVTRDIETSGSGLFAGMDLFFVAMILGIVPLLYFFVVRVVGEDAERVLQVFLGGVALFALFMLFIHAVPFFLGALIRLSLKPFKRAYPVEIHLTQRTMTGSLGRVTATVCGLALVGAALVALRGMTEGLKQEVRDFSTQALEQKLFCRVVPTKPGDPESEKALLKQPLKRERVDELVASVPGVVGLEPSQYSGFPVLQAPFTLRAIDSQAVGFGPLTRKENLRVSFDDVQKPGILISSRLNALQPELFRRGTVSLPTRTKAGSVEARVLGVTNAYGHFDDERVYAVASEEFFRVYHCADLKRLDRFVLRLSPNADEARVMAQVRESLGPDYALSITAGSEKQRAQLEDIDRDFFLFDIILILVCTLAGLGLLNSLWIGALERLREISVLKAIGMTPAQVRRMLLVEAFSTGSLGGILGMLLGIPFLLLILSGLERISGLAIQFVVPWPWVFGSAVLCAGIGVVAGLLPAWRASRFQPVAILRTE